MELVEKGRTMSIDQALQNAAPRTWSVDSIDYSDMVQGPIDEETAATLRKRRRQHKKHHHWIVCLPLLIFNPFSLSSSIRLRRLTGLHPIS